MDRVPPNLVQIFDATVQRMPTKVAIQSDGQEITYQELQQRTYSWAEALEQMGIQPGERLIFLVNHRFEFPAVLLGLWRIGGVAIPLEATITPPELARAIDASKADWVLSENPSHIEGIPATIERVENCLHPSWVSVRLVSSDSPCAPEMAFFLYTSGTTGTPKCVSYDHQAAAAIVMAQHIAYPLSEEDKMLTPLAPPLPATWVGGIVPALTAGTTLILPGEPVPGRVLKLIAETKATIFFAVPYFYDLLIKAMEVRKNANWTSVRRCLSTSAYLPGHTFDAFYRLTHIPIRSVYCTSEANQCTFNTSEDLLRLRNSVGTVQDGVQLRIVDSEGNDLPAGQEGEIVATGTHLSKGYVYRPELEPLVYKNHWVHTGDLGLMDEEGYLYITGRISNTINVGGFLVNPQEVEEVLTTHPAVAEALVLGEGDVMVGEWVIGWVVLQPDYHVTADDLIQHCKQLLNHYKVPHRIEFVKELPKGRYGKIRRMTPVTEALPSA